MATKQLGLPFPRPARAEAWPNDLGFDLGEVRVMDDPILDAVVAVVEVGEEVWRGRGANWVEAVSSIELAREEDGTWLS